MTAPAGTGPAGPGPGPAEDTSAGLAPSSDPAAEGPAFFEGAGLFSSWADVGAATGSDDPYRMAFAAAGAGLDTLAVVADPFDALAGAATGWLIEHLAFLREPLDLLAGDPGQVVTVARSWHGAAVELGAVADELRGGPSAPDGWTDHGWSGVAGEAHRGSVRSAADGVASAAAQADELAATLIRAGAAIGTVRALVRDVIAGFVAEVAGWLLAGSLAAVLTGGVSVAASVGWVIVDAIRLATRIADRIGDLLRSLADAGHAASGLATGMLDLAARVRTAAPALQAGAVPVVEVVDTGAVRAVIEAGKQTTASTLD